jgi:Predicted transcriptional regulator with C-terminal CBS domains
MDYDAKKIGLKIREKRLSLGISQEKLALITDIDRSYVGRVERGEVNLTVEKLYQFCAALSCLPGDLLT